ncbi:ABC transporter permease [Rhodovibrionaceae bacterium A322]
MKISLNITPSAVIYLLAALVALWLPVSTGGQGGEALTWPDFPLALACWLVGIVTVLLSTTSFTQSPLGVLLVTVGTLIAALPPLIFTDAALLSGSVAGAGAYGVWLYLAGLPFLVWRVMAILSGESKLPQHLEQIAGLFVPIAFGIWLLYLWEVIVTGFGVPQVLLPAPSLISQVFLQGTATLMADFQQTFIKSVIPGFIMGCGSGFVIAILVDRVPFLQRGLLPVGNLVSALPIVGVAPIMVMWFGFDWQSKAAVVVVMTFFPMLVNTLSGLNATSKIEQDLMRSYGASYFQTLFNLRLPNALPFIFNALKINSTLALIGAIVAEFFGTPVVGMGFRISTEVGRMNVDMVWATIAVAAVAGSLFYGGLALLERRVTFWHPSYRRR